MIENQVRKYRDGDESVRDELILHHMPIVDKLVCKFINKTHTKDELKEVAYFELVLSVKRAKRTLKDDNLTPYVIRCVQHNLINYVRLKFLVIYKRLPRNCANLRERLHLDDPVDNECEPGFNIELEELIELSIESEVQRAVVRLRLEGETFNSIAAELKVSIKVVRRLWFSFVSNFKQRCSAERK